MTDWAADLAFVVVVVGAAIVVQQGGTVKAGVRLFIVIAAGLIAMNYFEPAAAFLSRLTDGPVATTYGLFGSLVLLFAGSILLLNFLANRLLPESADLSPGLDHAGRWVCGALAGIVTAAFLFTAVHTFPGPRDFWGYLPPEPRKRPGPILSNAPEEHWLRFTRHVAENVFVRSDGRSFEPNKTESTADAPPFVKRYAKWRAELE